MNPLGISSAQGIPRIAVIGAHPDDPDIIAGGSAILWRDLGHPVLFLSLTDGSAGHHQIEARALARRRREETKAVESQSGIRYQILGARDGALEPNLSNRLKLITCLRRFAPDLIITHPPDDYHPDHRYTSQLVGDASFLLRVPHICPEIPALTKPTVQAWVYHARQTTPPTGFVVAIPVDSVWKRKLDLLACHESQFFEFLPWLEGIDPLTLPPDRMGRIKWLEARRKPFPLASANQFRQVLLDRLGERVGAAARLAEVFYTCPYPEPLSPTNSELFFPKTMGIGSFLDG